MARRMSGRNGTGGAKKEYIQGSLAGSQLPMEGIACKRGRFHGGGASPPSHWC